MLTDAHVGEGGTAIYTILLSKSDFSFALLLVTFELLEVEQSYIPLLKALICGINFVKLLLALLAIIYPKGPFINYVTQLRRMGGQQKCNYWKLYLGY